MSRESPAEMVTMCNDYRMNVDLDSIRQDFADTKIRVRFPEGAPNMQPREDVRITDVAPIIRAADEPGVVDLIQRRWSWPGQGGRPVYNFRSDGREFSSGRCLIPVSGFYEFTTPADPKKKRKDKWLFTMAGREWFCIAGLWRATKEVGEAFTMLTMEPGPEVAPYHSRQVVVLGPEQWAGWLDSGVPATAAFATPAIASLNVQAVG